MTTFYLQLAISLTTVAPVKWRPRTALITQALL